jgi:hypothetical protein
VCFSRLRIKESSDSFSVCVRVFEAIIVLQQEGKSYKCYNESSLLFET